ncbi:SRO77 (YBL106C) and SRO7 (YPR032W) [Zygosaccharomyces parabailii]|nr:SRO77 (YBL106C) and SRO7 (YPR032W) [Zygosaccharomyces parabailii]
MFGTKKLKSVSRRFKSDKTKTSKSEGLPPNQLGSSEPEKPNTGLLGGRNSRRGFSIRGSDTSGAGTNTNLYTVRELNRYGLKGKAVIAAFDFTQSLLAVATDAGEIHVFGKQQVEVTFTLQAPTVIKHMRFMKGIYLVAIDQKEIIMVFSLYTKKMLQSFFSPGKIHCVETDPTLDWLLLGFTNGVIMVYDVDRDSLSEYKIENLQKTQFFPQERVSAVVSMQWNPRDVGSLLISYEYVTVVYSLIDKQVKQHFIYDLPPYAPGGEYSDTPLKHRKPKVIQSLYHPNSLHIMTLHEDNSMVFWDCNTGQLIQARTIFEADVHIPQKNLVEPIPGVPRIRKAAWICQSNPEYTSLLLLTESKQTGNAFTMIDLGGTPLYSITTYEGMSRYYANTKNQKIFPLEKKIPVVEFLPIPKKSPHFAGCHDPGVILVLLDNGELETMMYPSGLFTYKSTLFPQTLAWIRPHATTAVATAAPKKLWFGMMSVARNNDSILKGGMPVRKDIRASDIRSALATGHTNGSIRVWDASHNELSDSSVFELSLSRILNKGTDLAVEHISFSPETLELSAAIESGEVVFFKFEANQFYNPNAANNTRELEMEFRRFSLNDFKTVLIDVKDRSSEKIKQGFMPETVVHAKRGKVSLVKNSNVGFVCIGYYDGTLIVVDRRGPVVTFIGNVRTISKMSGSCVTAAEFATMEYGNDGYSSVLLFCGTDGGDLITFKIIPNGKGTFDTHCVDSAKTNRSSIFKIDPFSKETGRSCVATVALMKALTTGACDHGCIIVSSADEVQMISPGKSSERHKSFKSPLAATSLCFVPHIDSRGELIVSTVFASLHMSGQVKVMSIPDLKEILSVNTPLSIPPQFANDCYVLRNGDIYVRLADCQSILLSIVNLKATGLDKGYNQLTETATDNLYNSSLKIPYRPQVNGLQWARGTVYCTAEEIDTLLGGDKRGLSKYDESRVAGKTITTKPDEPRRTAGDTNEFTYKRPVRNPHRKSQSMFKGVSRAFENKWDEVEDRVNDYAADMSEGLNEVFEDTAKSMTKGALGF